LINSHFILRVLEVPVLHKLHHLSTRLAWLRFAFKKSRNLKSARGEKSFYFCGKTSGSSTLLLFPNIVEIGKMLMKDFTHLLSDMIFLLGNDGLSQTFPKCQASSLYSLKTTQRYAVLCKLFYASKSLHLIVAWCCIWQVLFICFFN
jgi:hypothetical protein